MGLVHAFSPFPVSLLIWIVPPTLGVINFSVDRQNTIISSKLFKWVVINLPFASPCSFGVRRVQLSPNTARAILGGFSGADWHRAGSESFSGVSRVGAD